MQASSKSDTEENSRCGALQKCSREKIEVKDPGYSVSLNNVRKLSLPRPRDPQNKQMMLFPTCFAIENRISFRHLDDIKDARSVREIRLENYLPSPDDWINLHKRMEVVVKTIVRNNFCQFRDRSVEIIQHRNIDISGKKSVIVNLGILQENSASARGTLELLKYLNKYVPKGQNGHPYPILCHGNQLSVERMVTAKRSSLLCMNEADLFSGLIPRPLEFHKRQIVFQDSIKMLLKRNMVEDKGSLLHIKNRMHFRHVKNIKSNCKHSAMDFFHLVTEANVCLIVCKMLNIENIDGYSNVIPNDDIKRQIMFEDICKRVVQLVWPQIEMTSIQKAGMDVDKRHIELPEVVEDRISADSVFQYSCCMVWRGLLHIVQRDAERYNNGDQLISDWRLNMIEFWNHNHYKYLILGHRLLAGINGWLPARIRNEIIWNSTVNLLGKPGHNIALDLVTDRTTANEHTSKITSSKSRNLVQSIERVNEKTFQDYIVCDCIPNTSAADAFKKCRIKEFIEEYRTEDLFDDKNIARHHNGFSKFRHSISVKNPEKLNSRLRRYGKALETERKCD